MLKNWKFPDKFSLENPRSRLLRGEWKGGGEGESKFSSPPPTTNIHPSTRHLPGQTSQAPRTETLRMPAACFSFKWFIHTGILRDAFHAFYVPAKRIPRTCVRTWPALRQVAVDTTPPPILHRHTCCLKQESPLFVFHSLSLSLRKRGEGGGGIVENATPSIRRRIILWNAL